MIDLMYEKLQRFTWADGLLILGLLMVIIGLGISWRDNFQQKSVQIKKVELKKETVKETLVVVIDISGEVIKPGVYQLKSGDRIKDALVLAGGLGEKADRDWVGKNLNQAELLRDGQKVYIPRINEVVKSDVLGAKTTKMVSLNKATLDELDTLSGVGPAIAGRIIDYREKNGGFKSVEELKLVSGIGEKLFEKVKDGISL